MSHTGSCSLTSPPRDEREREEKVGLKMGGLLFFLQGEGGEKRECFVCFIVRGEVIWSIVFRKGEKKRKFFLNERKGYFDCFS